MKNLLTLMLLITFTSPGFATSGECIQLTGDYQCTLGDGTPSVNVSIQQKVNADQFPVLSVTYINRAGVSQTHEYVASHQIYDNYLALCDKDSFKVLFPQVDGSIAIFDYFMNGEEGKMNIDRLLGVLQPSQDPQVLQMAITGDQGRFSCTKQ